MPLVQCSECKESISDKAQICPHCGNPMRATVIEATGKLWKILILGGWLLVLPGAYLVLRGASERGWFDPRVGLGFMLGALGLALLVAGRLGSWWNHK